MVSSKALDKIEVWREYIRDLNSADLSPSSLVVEQTSVFCDASRAGFDAYINEKEDR